MLNLRALRKNMGLSQAQLAKALGHTQNTISNWESGRRKPDTATLMILADFFHVSVDCILGKEPAPVSPAKKDVDESELLNKSLRDLFEHQDGILFFDGKPLDDETKRLLIASLKNSIRMAKVMNERKRKNFMDD